MSTMVTKPDIPYCIFTRERVETPQEKCLLRHEIRDVFH